MSVRDSTESIILSAHAESIKLSAPPAESMILVAPPAESMILSVHAESMILSAHAESMILSESGTKQQSTKSCSGKCGDNGSGRGNSGSGDRFDVSSSNDDCSDDSNGDGNVDGDMINCVMAKS
jgi:hypothetical protein